jgi:hypothetical protein
MPRIISALLVGWLSLQSWGVAPAQEKRTIQIPGVYERIPTDAKELDLTLHPVTDEGLKDLKELKQLANLNLVFTAVTNEGMKELKELKILTTLNVAGTNVTDEGVKELQAALPKCKIIK